MNRFKTKINRGFARMDFSLSETRVKSEFKDEADPNFIMKRYKATGQLPPALAFNQSRAIYGDFSELGDFAIMNEKINRAKEMFYSLPASIKAKFGSDPDKFFAWFNNPANYEEAVKLHLRDKSELPVKESIQTSVPEPGLAAPAEASVKAEQLA